MAKRLEDTVLDASLNRWGEGTVLHVCSGEPTDWASMVAQSLATAVIGPSDFTGPAAGDTSGRKITKNAQSGMSITASGNADHVALGITTGNVFLGATTAPSQPLTAGGTVSTAAFDYEQQAPT